MSSASLPAEIARPVARKVSRLRWMVRLYVLVEGLAAVLIAGGLTFWAALAIDWMFEPSVAVRLLMWTAAAFAVAVVAFRFLLGRIAAPLTDANLALLLERRFGDFHDSLITTVESLGNRDAAQFEHALLRQTGEQALRTARSASLLKVFRARPLLRKAVLAALLAAATAAFAILEQEAFGTWVDRMQLSENLWPRRAALQVVGFEPVDGVRQRKVARDDDFELIVLASILDDHVAPSKVEIRYRLADGRRGRDAMTRVGEAIPGRDEAERYRYVFKNIVSDMSFDVVGDDDRVRDLRLKVVARPTVRKTALACTYPDYLQQAPRSIAVSGRAELPEGVSAVCRVEASKLLTEVRVHDASLQVDRPAIGLSEPSAQFEFELPDLREDKILMLTMRDIDGVENRQPYRLAIAVIPDQPPEVSVQLRGVGMAVTSKAMLPLAGRVNDDHGIESLWYEVDVDQSGAVARHNEMKIDGLLEVDQFPRLDLAANDPASGRPLIEVQPGQKLTLVMRAQDAYNLDGLPHVGSSQRFLLDVVTPSELRALLERQELGLRQRFEAIYDKMTGARDLLDRVRPAVVSDSSPSSDSPAETGGSSEPESMPAEAAVANGEDTAAAQRQAEQAVERSRGRISGTRQNTTQLAFETLGVADGFQQIVAELVNNRIATEELKERLNEGIAEPLTHIGGVLMPELESALESLHAAYGSDDEQTKRRFVEAKTQADAVVEAMKDVLDRMLELESYNELVELLRSIVAEQEKLGARTKDEQKAKLRSLLED